jgi:CelD/BcsL family acetyltransferase involved in cellulose biosynthesis
MAALIPRWQKTTYRLSYRIGELTLLSRDFPALALKNHFLELPFRPGEPEPPPDLAQGRIRAAVVLSHPVDSLLPRFYSSARLLRYVPSQYSHFYTALTGTFEHYLAKFSTKTRNTLRRKVRRFLDHGEGSGIREYKRPEEMEEFLALARTISANTYQEKLFDAGIPSDAEFLQELEDRARRNAVRAYLLFLRNDPVAYLCCPADGPVLLYSYLGYKPESAELSPGTVLQYLAFESLFREQQFTVFDFTQGQGDHKRFFSTHEVRCADLLYFRDSLSSHFWTRLHAGIDGTSAFAGRVLERLGLKARIKRLIRRL